ncbi:MAG TPA: hypothetical protein VN622_07505 [Clostridia bacterium]|nr:hypothetical protein [Clostridia bacterium]
MRSTLRISLCIALVLSACFAASAQDVSQNPRTIAINQTEGFGEGQELVFTYLMNFMCIHEPFDDLNNNGKVAAIDPREFQRPICQVGHQPTIDPTGAPIGGVEKLWVIVPFFPGHNDRAFTPELATALKQLFGFVPQGFSPHPDVPVQCPEPGPPETAHKGKLSTCTMHPTHLELGPALAKMGKVPPGTSVVVPTPNHSHILDETQKPAVWWQIISVLVTDPNAWPDEEGTRGINSIDALREAQARHQATPDAPTNFFLFFSAKPEHAH